MENLPFSSLVASVSDIKSLKWKTKIVTPKRLTALRNFWESSSPVYIFLFHYILLQSFLITVRVFPFDRIFKKDKQTKKCLPFIQKNRIVRYSSLALTFISFARFFQLFQPFSLSLPQSKKQLCSNSPAGINLLKVNYRNTRTRYEICSKLTIKTPERRHWRRSGVFSVNFDHISHLVLVLLLTLSM